MNFEKYRNIPFETRGQCIACHNKTIESLIELKDFPITEIYVKTPQEEKTGFLDQNLQFCPQCQSAQLAKIIPGDFLYTENYATRSSMSASAKNALETFFNFIQKHSQQSYFPQILELGCNDTYLLQKFTQFSDQLFGIDPILKGREKEFAESKITAFGDLFENVDLAQLSITPNLILSSHMLEHVSDPKKLIASLLDKASDQTEFFFQFPSLEALVKNARFDQMHHQHLNYFSVNSVKTILNELGAELIQYEINFDHWGALMIYFKKSSKNINQISPNPHLNSEMIISQFETFQKMMEICNERILKLEDEVFYAFGAALMLPLQVYYLPALNSIQAILDDDPHKQGLSYLNFNIPILSCSQVPDWKEHPIIITAINSKLVLRSILKHLIQSGVRDIIVPSQII